MRPDQFVIWLSGYFAAYGGNTGNMAQGDWKVIAAKLDEVLQAQAAPPPPRPVQPPIPDGPLKRALDREKFLLHLPGTVVSY